MPTKDNPNFLPNNPQAEQACLGSAFLSRGALFSVISELDEDDFFEAKHQLLYRVIKTLTERKINVDVLTVTEELINNKWMDQVGGVEYLKQCSDSMVALASLDFYISIVKNQSTLRNLLKTIRAIDNEYLNNQINDINDFIARSELQIKTATEKRRVSSFKNMEEVTTNIKLAFDHQQSAGVDGVVGVTTGYPNLNKFISGFQPSELTIIAARPSVGKTALALNFAYNAATRANVPVAIFSLEMSSESLVKRLIAMASSVPLDKINTGLLNASERANVNNGIRDVAKAPIYIDDSPGIRLMDIVAKSRQLQAKIPNLGLIVIDYLGLVTTGEKSKNSDPRHEEVRKISLALKGLARDLKLPVIVVCQLGRDVEKRDNKRPMLSDLRDSGSIEQDADVVLLLYREDYYSDYAKKDKGDNKKLKDLSSSQRGEQNNSLRIKQLAESMPGNASYVEVKVAKNRNGQIGNVALFFYKSFGRFEHPSPEWEEQIRNIQSSSDID